MMNYKQFTRLWRDQKGRAHEWPSSWNADSTWEIMEKLQSMTPQEFMHNSTLYRGDNLDKFWDLKDEGAIVLYQTDKKVDDNSLLFINFRYSGPTHTKEFGFKPKGFVYLILHMAPPQLHRPYNIRTFSRHPGISLERARGEMGAEDYFPLGEGVIGWRVLRGGNIQSFLNWIGENPLEGK